MRRVAAVLGMLAIFSGCSSSSVDARRLHALGKDPLATVAAPGTSLIHRYVTVGNGYGTGTATSVLVTRRLDGSRSSVARFYAEVAIRADWRVHVSCLTSSDVITATKQFPGWVAAAFVG